jgi:hypothetical protein
MDKRRRQFADCRRLGLRTSGFDQFVTIVFSFLFRAFSAQVGEALQKVRKFLLVSGFPQSLDEMAEGCLVLRIQFEGFPTLLDRKLVLP